MLWEWTDKVAKKGNESIRTKNDGIQFRLIGKFIYSLWIFTVTLDVATAHRRRRQWREMKREREREKHVVHFTILQTVSAPSPRVGQPADTRWTTKVNRRNEWMCVSCVCVCIENRVWNCLRRPRRSSKIAIGLLSNLLIFVCCLDSACIANENHNFFLPISHTLPMWWVHIDSVYGIHYSSTRYRVRFVPFEQRMKERVTPYSQISVMHWTMARRT